MNLKYLTVTDLMKEKFTSTSSLISSWDRCTSYIFCLKPHLRKKEGIRERGEVSPTGSRPFFETILPQFWFKNFQPYLNSFHLKNYWEERYVPAAIHSSEKLLCILFFPHLRESCLRTEFFRDKKSYVIWRYFGNGKC